MRGNRVTRLPGRASRPDLTDAALFRQELGHRDEDWPSWYAKFIVDRLDQPRGIGLDAEDLRILEAALHSYLDDFGHEEADVLRQVKSTLAKVRAT